MAMPGLAGLSMGLSQSHILRRKARTSWVPEQSNSVFCFRSRRFVDPTSKWERLRETIDPGTPAFYSRHSSDSHNFSQYKNSQPEAGERLLEFLTREHRFRSLSSRIVTLKSTTESPNSLPGTAREHQNWSSPRVCCSTRRILSISWNSGVSKVISLDLLWG